MVLSFPFSLEGKKQRFRFDYLLFLISPIKSIPFLNFSRDHLRSTSRDHLRSTRIICGPFWGSFTVSGSFADGDHLRYCTTFHRRTTYCDFYDLKQITKTENFSPTGIAYTIRIYLWIIQQTQPHLFANVRKHNSKRIFAL